MFYVGRFREAERDLAKGVRLEPSDAYAVIWLYLGRVRAPGGKPDAEALRAETSKMDLNKWPGPVVSMYLGELTPETLRDTARSNNPKTDREQGCEANFYIGELRLMERRQEEATSLFRTALETCPRNFFGWCRKVGGESESWRKLLVVKP
jgi:lipoprotein NlpI